MSGALTAREIAGQSQSKASDPSVSAFVTASAGSGKTKLLTDRLLRLILGGARPERLLCLTFTKAAAAEMATRLNGRLGQWAVAESAALAADLHTLLGHPATAEETARARAAFAAVLELPGGMRIATLHAFAQSLLRSFPLEAGLPPGFSVLEEMDAAVELSTAREAELLISPALERLAALSNASGLGGLMAELRRAEPMLQAGLEALGGLPMLLAEIAQRLGIEPDADEASLRREAATPPAERDLARAAAMLALGSEKTDAPRGAAMKAWLAQDESGREALLEDWTGIFITGDGTVRKSFATRATGANQGSVQSLCEAEGERLLRLMTQAQAVALLRATEAALVLGLPVLKRFAAAKQRIGRLDYDDLIAAARKLLENPGSAWVLYKLDGGLDHVLLDEAQDSNPEQWGIARALTGEFFSGAGTREEGAPPRTIFAVGDVKQSIYGFQGADAGGLPRAEGEFRATIEEGRFRSVPLEVSFRSAPPVLELVDAVFAEGPARSGVVEEGQVLHHLADRQGAAGLVELWPLQAQGARAEPPEWEVPESATGETGADARLAAALAARIRHMIRHERLPARHEGDPSQGRRIRAGDILILVRRRNAFVGHLVRALKEREVPVGGVDRMLLVGQLAVQDVLAVLDSILLPQDELQLAAALKSPILGLDDDQLFALAHDRRPSTLHARLMAQRGADTPTGRAADLLAALTARADHVPPHALIAEILGERGGRARLLARLGPDAADPLDELLTAAMAHERLHPASLQGFLHWMRRASAEVKREPDTSADLVRVMTVHGAKGLQSPIVILPDTTSGPPQSAGLRWTEEELPLWAPRKTGFAAPAYADADAIRAEREAQESNRLLYVALTRAEDRLLVCGWHGARLPVAGCWYEKVAAGFRRLDGVAAQRFEPGAWGADPAGFADGPLWRLESPQTDPRRDETRREASLAATMPAWTRIPARTAETPAIATPSHMEDTEVELAVAAPHAPGDPLGKRFRRGNLIHALLQSLPDLPAADRDGAGRAWLARPGQGLDAGQVEDILAEALGVMADPEIAPAFGPGSLAEAPLAGRIGERLILGQVDRLLVLPEKILVLDFKTNRPPPLTSDAAPPAYLRQMAAYRAVLRAAFPGRPVECALVWTYGARAMPLPAMLLDRYAPA